MSKVCVKILEIAGRGWREVYEVKPDGTHVLLYAYSSRPTKHNIEDATSATFVTEMPYSEFVKRFPESKYAKS